VQQAASIPVIDIAPLVHMYNASSAENPVTPACSEVISALSIAATSHGIFAITGHGIPFEVMDAALASTMDALDVGGHAETECWQELEERVSTRAQGELSNFVPVGRENVGRMYNGDAKAADEAVAKFSVWPSSWEQDPTVAERSCNVWPSTSNGAVLREALEGYYAEVQRVSDVLHYGLAQAIGQPGNFIKDMLEPYGSGILRAMRYQRNDDADMAAPAMAAHTDLGTTTLLLSDAMGLQFQPRDSSEWIDVVVPRGALAVNLGEFFEVWTRGAWRATPHRVSAAGRRGRTSLAFFSNQGIPSPSDGHSLKDCVIVPLDSRYDSGETLQPTEEDSQQSVRWPSYFFERLADLTARKNGDAIRDSSIGGA